MVMPLKWLAVINPTSAGGRALKSWYYIKQILQKLQINYDEVITEYSAHAIELVRKESSNYDGILAIGGDGTTNEVLNGILLSSSPNTALGIIPTGTGNDIAFDIDSSGVLIV